MCAEDRAVEIAQVRTRYLATFIATPAWHTTIYADPSVPSTSVAEIGRQLELIHGFATAQLGLNSEPPAIFVYPTVEELRRHSCTSKIALAYYDGAIHMTADMKELRQSLRHEYAHHVLLSNGINGPTWFQEGTAMKFASDCPYGAYQTWRAHRFEPRQMVAGATHTTSPEAANVFNAQACIMTEFLDRLCLQLEECGTKQLAAALVEGQTTPEGLFDWAISRRGADLFRTTNRALWQDYADRGDFAPATKQALLSRAGRSSK